MASGGVVFSRCAGAALLDVGGGEKVWALTLHLHPRDVPTRKAEAAVLRSRIPELLMATPHMLISVRASRK